MHKKSKSFITLMIWITLSFPLLVGQGLESSYRHHPLLELGDSLFNQQQIKEATNSYTRAKATFETEQKWDSYLYALNQLGKILLDQNDTLLQLTVANCWLKVQNQVPADHFEVAQYFFLQGQLQIKSKHTDAARLSLLKSIQIWQKHLPSSADAITKALEVLANLHIKKGEYFRASDYLKRIEAICKKHRINDHESLARIYLNSGINYRDAGATFRASDYLDQALRYYQQDPKKYLDQISNCLLVLGNSFFDADKFSLAKDYYLKTTKLLQQNSVLQSRIITTYNNLGSAYSHLGNADSAVYYFNRALSINREPNFIAQKLGESYMQYAEHFQHQTMFDSSQYYYRKSHRILNSVANHDSLEISLLWLKLAEISTFQHQNDSGFIFFNNAIITHPSIQHSDLFVDRATDLTNKVDELYEFIRIRALLLNKEYRQTSDKAKLRDALQCYNFLDSMVNVIRNGPFGDRTRRVISGAFRQNADEALTCIAALQQAGDSYEHVGFALNLMEKTRYSELFRKITKAQFRDEGLVPDSIYERELEILSTIRTNEVAQQSEDIPNFEKNQERLFEARQQLQQYKDEMSTRFPTYYHLKYDALLTIPKLQKELNKKDQLLEYFWGDSLLSIVAISSSNAKLAFVPISDSLRYWLSQTLSQISKNNEGNPSFNYTAFSHVTNNLYKTILEPFLEDQIDNIIISPDGDLSFLPFDLLITSPIQTSFRKAPYLLREKSIQYSYSSNLLFKDTEISRIRKPKLLAFAYSDQETLAVEHDQKMREIPASIHEIKTISQLFSKNRVQLFHGLEAKEAVFKKEAAHSHLLHLALHGISDTLADTRSHIVFRDIPSHEVDGNLFTHEIYDLDLSDTRLVVLSACQSGIGKHIEGEGIFSAARAFMYAGTPSVVMSLWNADDEITSRIMARLYHHLFRGASVHKAVQLAKLDYLENADHERLCQPYYWATFVALGHTAPVIPRKRKLIGILTIGSVVLLVAFIRSRSGKMKDVT